MAGGTGGGGGFAQRRAQDRPPILGTSATDKSHEIAHLEPAHPPVATASGTPSPAEATKLFGGQYDEKPMGGILTGLGSYTPVPDATKGELKPGQIRQSDFDELKKYGFDKMDVVQPDHKDKLTNTQMTQAQFEPSWDATCRA